jgi:HSP20 family protein
LTHATPERQGRRSISYGARGAPPGLANGDLRPWSSVSAGRRFGQDSDRWSIELSDRWSIELSDRWSIELVAHSIPSARRSGMAIEFREGNHLVIQAELPGIDPDRDLEVTIAHDVLHIRASRETGPDPANLRSDLRFGTFVRDIPLPDGTLEDQVVASYRDDLLEVRAPIGDHTRVAAVRIPVIRG